MLCLCGFALYSRWVPLTFRILLVYHLLAHASPEYNQLQCTFYEGGCTKFSPGYAFSSLTPYFLEERFAD